MSEAPCFVVFFERHPLHLRGECSPPKFRWYGFTGLRAAGPATAPSHRCDIPSLLKDNQIARDKRLPVHCRRVAVAATLYCHPGRHSNSGKHFQVKSNKILDLPRNFVFMTISGSHPCCIDYGTFFCQGSYGHVVTGSTLQRVQIGMLSSDWHDHNAVCISVLVVKWLEFGIELVELNEPTLPKRHDKYS